MKVPIGGADFRYVFSLTRFDGAPDAGLATVHAYVAGDEPGPAVTPGLDIAAVETTVDGRYEVTFPGTELRAAFPPARLGRSVWIVIADGARVLATDWGRLVWAPEAEAP